MSAALCFRAQGRPDDHNLAREHLNRVQVIHEGAEFHFLCHEPINENISLNMTEWYKSNVENVEKMSLIKRNVFHLKKQTLKSNFTKLKIMKMHENYEDPH